jgi:glycosyltransferase involved in cell wall biosynthesis
MPDPRVSVVIRCFNEEKHIGALLERVYQQTIRSPQVILVDSGSTDRTLAVAGRYPVQVEQVQPAEFTFGRSLNRGCRVATGDYLVFASAHVVPCELDWLKRLTEPFNCTQVALVYGRQLGDHRTKFSEHQVFTKQYPLESNPDQRIPFCNNANAAVRRALWLKHAFDETLSGLEDLEWGKWAVEQGYRIAYRADAGVYHIHEEAPSGIKRRYMREAIALKRLFPDSHVTWWEFVALLVSNVARDLAAALRRGVLFSKAVEILMFRTMQYWGTYRGMNYRSPLTHELIMQFYYPRSWYPRSWRRAARKGSGGAVLEGQYDRPRP